MPKRPRSREEEEHLLGLTQPSSRTYDDKVHSNHDHDEAKEVLLSKHRSQYLNADVDDGNETLVEGPGTSWKLKSPWDDEDHGRKQRRWIIIGAVLFLIVMILAAVWGRPLILPAPHSLQAPEELALQQNDPNAILSNGTHQYQKTVLLVSIDGLRLVISPFTVNRAQTTSQSLISRLGTDTPSPPYIEARSSGSVYETCVPSEYSIRLENI
jgi:hypothetical protein